jgi:hypothetical protein
MFKFIKEQDESNPYSITRVEHQVNAEALPEILEEFELFLKGCGFQFDGTVDIISVEEE